MSVEPDPSTDPVAEDVEQPSVLVTPSAVLDSAHLGDIEGALGTIRTADSGESTSLKRRLLTFAAILGPGLIVMVGDNDAGGVSTYSQAGQNYGYRDRKSVV